jgi:phytoene/squalene synthetase
LRQQLQAFALPLTLLHDLLDAFEQDVRNPRYPDRAALLDYCRRSANPVGRLLLHLYGVHDAAGAAPVGRHLQPLQLINFWQDLSVDLARGRHYVPGRPGRHGVAPPTCSAATARRPRALVRDCATGPRT